MIFPHPARILLAASIAALSANTFAASPAWLTAHDKEIKELVGRMTLEEKVGQMTQPDLKALKDHGDIEKLFLGSVLSGGSSDPKTGNGVADWAEMTSECQSHALKTRLAIPLLYGIDAVHGHNNVLGAVVFPHNIGLGGMRNPALVEKIARVTAEEVRASGIQWAFAPCVAVPQDIRWGRTYEGFSEDPAIVAELGAAVVRGLQGADLTGPAAVLACAKHFVGDGGTNYGTSKGGALLDQGDARLDEATLRAVHMAGYPEAIAAGVGTIMPSYSSWNGEKCSGSRFLLTDVLKKELGFEGFVVSDYNAIDQLMPPVAKDSIVVSNNAAGQVKTSNYKQCIEISINAGMDMVMVTNRYKEFITLLMELTREGKVPMSRIDDAVTRILRVKYAQGLMDGNYNPKIDPKLRQAFGSAAHREVAREAVRQSVVLLKNEGGILPLTNGGGRIHIAGRGADDIGMQCGGWTVDWQGRMGDVTPGGTTILSALRGHVGSGGEVTVSADGSGAAGARVAVVVIGENPYAESKGDRADLALSKEDAAVVSTVKAAGVPVVLVVLSGRPVILGEVADQADAIVAAWLPGTEGGGVTDVLFGDAAPKGRLSYTWPRSMAQIPLASGAGSGPVLFPRGFGLDY
ncbi:MAG: glycoside hydrolase family 3 protein [Luteolibacter sp.]